MSAVNVPARRPFELAAIAGALLAAGTAQAIDAPLVLAVALACAAAAVAGLMLHGMALKLIAWVLLLLTVLGIIGAIEHASGWKYLAIAGLASALLASRVITRFASSWDRQVTRRRDNAPPDLWKQQDAGLDGTDDVPSGEDSR